MKLLLRPPTLPEARLLDMTNTLFYLSDLESKAGQKYWKTDKNKSREMLIHLRERGILDIFYWFDHRLTLSPVFSYLQGEESKVCSITYSLLKNTPSCLAMVTNDGTTSLVISRVSLEDKSDLAETIKTISKSANLDVECTFPSAHRNYTSDIYQRLLNPNRTWNDDVSAFLSQVRSTPKQIRSKTNQSEKT